MATNAKVHEKLISRGMFSRCWEMPRYKQEEKERKSFIYFWNILWLHGCFSTFWCSCFLNQTCVCACGTGLLILLCFLRRFFYLANAIKTPRRVSVFSSLEKIDLIANATYKPIMKFYLIVYRSCQQWRWKLIRWKEIQ